ncbi:MAG TPA: NapC/NirT family cytochrome c [Thermoanaerobaculia bacterium]|jgi:nitrate/TMAO reductase-like tetraheme cytochrome c subunit
MYSPDAQEAAPVSATSPSQAVKEGMEVPPPHGWVGTTNQWLRGVGISFAVLNLVLLAAVWISLRRRGITTISKAFLFGSILVLPVIVVFLATAQGMQESMTVDACGHCHVMDGHVQDLRNPKSESLAAVHYKNRYIQENHCYTCHSDYGMFGTVSAKMEGLGHVWHNTTGHYEKPIKIAKPYSNLRCLNCHSGSQKFLAKHDAEELPKLAAGTDSCLDCHGPAHTPAETKEAMK